MKQINLLAVVFSGVIGRAVCTLGAKTGPLSHPLGATIGGAVIAAGLILSVALPSQALADQVRVMVLGDSLVAGHGLPQGEAFPDILGEALGDAGHDVVMLNAGVSGDTSAGGLARLDWSLAENPDAMIVVLGGNDLLRGLEPAGTRANIAGIIERLASENIPVLLAGMQAPRNLGAEYALEFDALYRDIANGNDWAENQVVFYPFFLDGVALQAAFNQPDGLHPNLAGVREITRRILPYAETLVRAASPD